MTLFFFSYNFHLLPLERYLHKKVLLIALFATVIRCQESSVDENSSVTTGKENGKEKRGISLNLGTGLDGYSYSGYPSYSRG